jgi:hypothetical protein
VRGVAIASLSGLFITAALCQQAYGQAAWQKCGFNGKSEDCLFAGGSNSFTITFRSDGKQIEVEKVGEPYSCGKGDIDECGKMLITEPREGRATLATYRQASKTIIIRSARGNIYAIPNGPPFDALSESTSGGRHQRLSLGWLPVSPGR